MRKLREAGLDFFIDKMTNSIELVATGESFDTVVTLLTSKDKTQIINNQWQFNWDQELRQTGHSVYKLST